MIKKIILPGLLIGLISFMASMVVSQIFKIVFPSIGAEYQNLALFRAQSDPLMMLFFLHPFLVGIILAWFWSKAKNMFGEDMKGGIMFGLTYWVIATIPGMFATYSSMPYSLAIVTSWLISGLVTAIIGGIILVKLNKQRGV